MRLVIIWKPLNLPGSVARRATTFLDVVRAGLVEVRFHMMAGINGPMRR